MGCWTRDEMCGLAKQARLPRLGGTQTRTPLCGFRYRLCSARGVDQAQLSAGPMTNELKITRKRAKKIIRLRAKKVISLKAARKLLARRQLAGA